MDQSKGVGLNVSYLAENSLVEVYALNDQTGKALWDFQTGAAIASNPIAFTVDGHQRIAISADRVLYVFGL